MLNLSLLLTATLAGVAGGSHCIGMCGGIATVLARPAQSGRVIPISPAAPAAPSAPSEIPRGTWTALAQLHLGRLLTYAMSGAMVGTLGAAGLLLKPVMPVQAVLFFIGNLSLIYLGLRCLGYKVSLPGRAGQWFSIGQLFSKLRLPSLPILRGLLWGCLPCGLVYGVLPIALISGSPWAGAVLMFCFGLGTMPYLLIAHGLATRFGLRKAPAWVVMGAAAILISLGVLGLILPNEHHNAGWWC